MPIGFELQQELGAARLFVGLADGAGGRAHPVEGAQEPTVRLVLPADIARAPPAGLTQSIESAVIADAEACVGLDVVARECAELRPCVEESWPACHHVGDRVAPLFGRCGERVIERGERVGGFGRQHRLGETARAEVDVRHPPESTDKGVGRIARVSDPAESANPSQPSGGSDTANGADSSDGSGPPKPPTRLLLVRHAVTGHTGSVLSGRLPGIELSEKGRAQAEATAARLAKLPIGAIYASPITRTQQTAAIIAAHHALDVRTLDGVTEADFGDWTGGEIKELAKLPEWRVVQVAPSRARFPGGESMQEMQVRTVAALDGVVATHPNETVVVVSHSDPIASAIAHYTGVHLDLFQRIRVSPASVTVFEFHAFGAALLKSNDTGSFDDLLPPDPPPTPAAAPGS